MTPKQQRFVEEYLIDLNATQAAIRAGYAEKTARSQGQRLLTNVDVAKAIAKGQQQKAQNNEATAQQVIDELALIGFSDIGEVLDFTKEQLQLRPANEIPERARRAISSIKVRRYVEGPRDDPTEVEVTEFKFWSKDAALEKLAKHLGLLRDKLELTGKDGGPIETILGKMSQFDDAFEGDDDTEK